MKPDPRFLKQSKAFWANVRLISEKTGYTVRGEGQIKVPDLKEIVAALRKAGLSESHIVSPDGVVTNTGQLLLEYFLYRAKILNEVVRPNLMDADQAKVLYEKIKNKLRPHCPLPMIKQKGKKKTPAYLTCIVNMIVESNALGYSCDYDPRQLTTVTLNDAPLRTLARRVDGCFPATVNPIAIWEIKEYYHTTTFGSRVADGVYESLLDGMELEELYDSEGIDIKHYLIVDAYYTWWECGRSYLCRIIDMLHMGYLDEVMFGKEVVRTLPVLVKEWIRAAKKAGRKP